MVSGISASTISVCKTCQHTAMFSLESPKAVFWEPFCLSYLSMTSRIIFFLPYPIFLPMIINVYRPLDPQYDICTLQRDLDNTALWSYSSDLLFNETKFVHVRFWAKPTFDYDTTTYSVNGKPIKQFLSWYHFLQQSQLD